MSNFFKKYELPLKIFAIILWIYSAVDNFFFDTSDENRNFDVFIGIIKLLLAVYFIFDVIELVRKGRMKKEQTKSAE
jgi:hypothetical protein